MKFNPVLSYDEFSGNQNLLEEQKVAAEKGIFPNETKSEMDKLTKADLLILLAPMWWCSFPAMVKGWMDKILAKGFAWDDGRCNENGMMKGKKF